MFLECMNSQQEGLVNEVKFERKTKAREAC